MKRIAIGLVVVVAGCGPTLTELRDEPVRFSIDAPAGWERVSTCLKAQYADDYSITDLPDTPRRHTELVLYFQGAPGQRAAMAIFDIQGTGDASSKVTFRRRSLIGGEEAFEQRARDRIERCSKVVS